jgi:hypothetical protein
MWFHRTWILQEFVLARQIEFWLGHHRIELRAVTNGWRWITAAMPIVIQMHELADRVSNASAALFWRTRFEAGLRMLEAREKAQKGVLMSLPQALNLARSCLVSDPRDKIFGILSLTDAAAEPLPVVDYDAEVVDVYISCKSVVVRKYGYLAAVHD